MCRGTVNPEGTLYEEVSREIWQCRVVSIDDRVIGHAICQIVERRLCTVRYIIMYDPTQAKRLLLPATLVVGAEPGLILCDITSSEAELLPEYQESLSRLDELMIYQKLGRTPYWEEESGYPPIPTSTGLDTLFPPPPS